MVVPDDGCRLRLGGRSRRSKIPRLQVGKSEARLLLLKNDMIAGSLETKDVNCETVSSVVTRYRDFKLLRQILQRRGIESKDCFRMSLAKQINGLSWR